MLLYVYDYRLILASIVISMMAAFTGLALTRGLSGVSEGVRHMRIAMAAIALGGGIWTMHFVAMLAMRFEVAVYYRALPTVASVLIAILLAGLALILMHFGRRTGPRMVLSGTVLGLGIVIMHYTGLSAIEGCQPVHRPLGFAAAGGLAVAMGVLAIRVAYRRRRAVDILAATAVFGLSVAIVHFTAMYWTDFARTVAAAAEGPAIGNSHLALIVLVTAFVISGAFLMSGASFLSAFPGPQPAAAAGPPSDRPAAPADAEPPATPPAPGLRLPYEREGVTYFLPAAEVAAIRAEGHYTIAYTAEGRVFCPWSISEAERRLSEAGFFRVHRSYLVNTAKVSGFDRRKDNGICLFGDIPNLDHVPVSRSRVPGLRAHLGL
ncbi:MHYT domain-containing protein [Rhodovulum euryhalinum]|uniref:NO-binding membrane sensor protein with MHYT domain n=1 Tax=Rhodovulum euryhalinum TaxID=35805 RepID=A0A4R2KMP5_9RHOB|nr:MHYT domain-containing protein [Rhodovulum euryhalinum]TCO72026.1 NO-binding membrane sensor protein with MHYT domain [Rhodovulum euryhalinum]